MRRITNHEEECAGDHVPYRIDRVTVLQSVESLPYQVNAIEHDRHKDPSSRLAVAVRLDLFVFDELAQINPPFDESRGFSRKSFTLRTC